MAVKSSNDELLELTDFLQDIQQANRSAIEYTVSPVDRNLSL